MIQEKINRIQSSEEFSKNNIQGIILIKPQNISYMLGFKVISDALLFIPSKDLSNDVQQSNLLLFVLSWEAELIKKKIGSDNNLVKIIKIENQFTIKRSIKKLKLKSVGFEDDYLSLKKLKSFQSYFRIPNFLEAADVINNVRLIKSKKEIEYIKKACEISNIGFKTILDTIDNGISEKELSIEAEYSMRKAGAEGFAYQSIVASGENTLFPHVEPTERKIKNEDIIIVDLGPKFKEYCSDITRTFIFGKKSKEKKELIDLINRTQELILNNMKSKITGNHLDKLARNYILSQKKEWGKGFIHNLGHGIGIDVPEPPYLSPISDSILKENMVITIEPGLYIPSIGGARTEDVIVVKENGYKNLSNFKISL